MDERRKKAYRYLLYWAMLNIRPLYWARLSILNPFRWKRTMARVRRAGAIAEAMHNLAFFSALDFEHFDEDRFWQDMRWCDKHYPGDDPVRYRDVFDRELTGKGHLSPD